MGRRVNVGSLPRGTIFEASNALPQKRWCLISFDLKSFIEMRFDLRALVGSKQWTTYIFKTLKLTALNAKNRIPLNKAPITGMAVITDSNTFKETHSLLFLE